MEKKPFYLNTIPFILNADYKEEKEYVMNKTIKDNGVDDTRSADKCWVEVESELTPEAQQEILEESY